MPHAKTYDGKTAKEWSKSWGLSLGHTYRWLNKTETLGLKANSQRLVSHSARAVARKEIRKALRAWLEGVGSEAPDDPSLSEDALALWGEEVRRIAKLIHP